MKPNALFVSLGLFASVLPSCAAAQTAPPAAAATAGAKAPATATKPPANSSADDATAAPKPTAALFVAMPEIRVPIVDAGRLDGTLRVSIVLQAKSNSGSARLFNRMPDLRAAGLSTVIEFARLYASPYSPLDVERLSANLTASLTGTDPGIAKVLITHVIAKGP